VIEGESFLDTAALTGESVPRKVAAGDAVISGCVNGEGTLRIRVTKEYEDSTVAKILDLVENASNKKAQTEQFITRFARYYTPVVTIGAVLLAVIPPLLAGAAWSEWIRRACVFLIVSCPCALVISVPLGFFGGIGAASRMGILVKGSNYLEAVANVKTVVFDKTGTLTKGNFRVTEILQAQTGSTTHSSGEKEKSQDAVWKNEEAAGSNMWNEEQVKLLRLAALAEQYSNHPIARSVREAYEETFRANAEEDGNGTVDTVADERETDSVKDTKEMYAEDIRDVMEEAGHGVRALYKGKELLAGNEKLMRAHGVEINRNAASFGSDETSVPEYGAEHDARDEDRLAASGTVVHVAYDGSYRGAIVIADEIKEETKAALAQMKRAGITKTVMLTGDHKTVAEAVAAEAGIDEVHAELLPGDKVNALEVVMGGAEEGSAGDPERIRANKNNAVAFVGDGVNDAPVLMRADVGIAMGAMGSDAAIEAADIVLMDDRIAKIATVTDIARKTLTIVKQNIVFAIGVKLLILALGALGYASMWLAVFADVGVAVIAILNSMRMLRYRA
ncbi:MAG: heavy metal translocating P-type ATPase, partial [Lachnospiraceae bacterium]|nr:heavy metal translocating P-type ATPase [Lachnospiraceae bacterium]